ncbi:hypothetical protein EB796_017981 [Bugula neritina]|uniref:Uncharacterized protein n=1 Tax=Bugula neritina TaxID=10212 RepID=A0A7J7JCB8_BUGNE|nr:hypothetical protein EB796_017981 [Bugula neritina]
MQPIKAETIYKTRPFHDANDSSQIDIHQQLQGQPATASIIKNIIRLNNDQRCFRQLGHCCSHRKSRCNSNVVKTVKKCEENDEGIGLTLNNLFRSECCEFGTILHLAVHERSKDSVRTLLTLGAYPSCKNEAGVTALESATDAEIVAVFNEQLLHCIAQKDLARVEEYLDAGCDVNCVDSSRTRNTPLHWAASYGSPEILQVLIEDGGNTNAQNADGITPLHDAVQRKDQSIIKMLLDCNADVSLAAHSGKLAGKSPLDIADDTVYSMLTYQSPSDSQNVAPQRHADELSALVTKLEEQSAATSHVYDEIGVESSNGTASGEGDTTVADLSPIEQQLKLLWPTPQKLTIHPERGEFRAKDRIVIAAVSGPEPGIVHEMLNVWRAKRQSFLDLNIEFLMETIAYQTTPAIISFDIPSIVCQVDQNLFKTSSSYKLTILKNQIRVVASDWVDSTMPPQLSYSC